MSFLSFFNLNNRDKELSFHSLFCLSVESEFGKRAIVALELFSVLLHSLTLIFCIKHVFPPPMISWKEGEESNTKTGNFCREIEFATFPVEESELWFVNEEEKQHERYLYTFATYL